MIVRSFRFSPVCRNVEIDCFVIVVVLQKNHTLDSASKKYFESLGIAVDVKGHSSGCVDYEFLGGEVSIELLVQDLIVILLMAHELSPRRFGF